MPEHRRRRATPSGGGKPLAPFVLRAAQTRLLCCGSSMMLGHHPRRRASHPDPRRLQHGLSDFCHGLLGNFQQGVHVKRFIESAAKALVLTTRQ